MKTARVVQVRDLGPLTPLDVTETDQDEDRVNRIAELLRLYPHVAEAEKAEILLFLTKGPRAEIDRIARRNGLTPRLMRFRRDHPEHFRLITAQLAGLAAMMLLPLAAFCLGLVRLTALPGRTAPASLAVARAPTGPSPLRTAGGGRRPQRHSIRVRPWQRSRTGYRRGHASNLNALRRFGRTRSWSGLKGKYRCDCPPCFA